MKQVAQQVARKRYSSDLSVRAWQQLEPLLVVRRHSKQGVAPLRPGHRIAYGLRWQGLQGVVHHCFLPNK